MTQHPRKVSETGIAIGFGLAIVILCGVAVESYLSLQRLNQSRLWVSHTYQVLDSLNDIAHGVDEMVDSAGSYFLSQNPQEQKRYWEAVQSTNAAIATTRQLTKDNPAHQYRLGQLEIQLAEQLVELHQRQKISPSKTGIVPKRAILQPVTSTLEAMAMMERQLLRRRIAETDRANRLAVGFSIGGYGLSFCLLLGVYGLLRRQVRDRTQAEQRLQDVNTQLAGTIQDVSVANTNLKQEIGERMQTELELAKLSIALRQSNQELEQFAYVASHDLQEPLRAVTSYTQLLVRNYQALLDDKAEKYIHYIVDGATRMQQLINDLLDYSRVGKQALKLEPTDCNAVLSQVLATMEVAIDENQATITADPLPTVIVDQHRFTQLLQNLISNALKYRRDEPPRIHISASLSGQLWLFSVRDYGIGIESPYLERIFVIFQRLHTRRQYPGTGIGLAICKRIVELHQGKIWVESQPAIGSTFYFTIPTNAPLSLTPSS